MKVIKLIMERMILFLFYSADWLFHYIANETNTKKSSSTYGLKLPSNRTTSETTPPVNGKKDQ